MTVVWHQIRDLHVSWDRRSDASRFIITRRSSGRVECIAQGLLDGQLLPTGEVAILFDDVEDAARVPDSVCAQMVALWRSMRDEVVRERGTNR